LLNVTLRQKLRRYDWARRLHKLTMKNKDFAVDKFPKHHADRIETVSGWYIPEHPEECRLQICLNDTPLAGLLATHRHDLAAAFPHLPRAVQSGFVGDLVIPPEIRPGEKFILSVRAMYSDESVILIEEKLELREHETELNTRKIHFRDILRDPLSGESVCPEAGKFRTTGTAGRTIPSIGGVPHFFPAGKPCVVRLTERGTTHPYSSQAQQLIETSKLVLNFGAGIQSRDRLRDHVISLDAIHFPWIDVVNTCRSLPFQDNVFDAVISQAVFEHLPDPFFAARELYRVLRPGGRALIDTAFMQPFHGDPDHYFNMTRSGLRQIMQGFQIEELGVRPYQHPSLGLIMQIEAILPFVSSSDWRDRLNHTLTIIKRDGDSFDSCLGEVGRETIAAGVYVVARKPP
jgi:Methyltransferase domain